MLIDEKPEALHPPAIWDGGETQRRRTNQWIGTISCYLLAGVVPTVIAWFITFRELTPAAGYATFPLQDKALIPYRDYFDPVPPLTYFAAHITAGGNYGLHNYELLSLAVVPVFGMACFSLGKLLLGNIGSLLLVVLMEALLVSERLEQVGGWNSQFFMLMAIGFVLFVHSVRLQQSAKGSTHLTAYALGLGSGTFLGLAIIEKQTCALTIAAVALLMILWMFWERKDPIIRSISTAGVASLIGALPVFALTAAFLILNRAWTPFVNDMLSGGGKNPQISTFGSEVYHAITDYVPLSFVIAAIGLPVALYFWSKFESRGSVIGPSRQGYAAKYYSIIVAIAFLLWRFSGAYEPRLLGPFLVIDALGGLLAVLVYKCGPRIPGQIQRLFAYCVVIVLLVGFTLYLGGSPFEFVTRLGTVDSALISLIIVIVISTTVMLIPSGLKPTAVKYFSIYFTKTSVAFYELRFMILFANAFSIAALINIFSSAGGVYIQWFIPQAVIYFSLVCLILRDYARHFMILSIAGTWLLLALTSSLAITLNNPYSWFNWTESASYSTHSSSQLPNNYGFQLSAGDAAFYSRIHSDALQAASILHMGNAATVFSYPNIPAAATVTGLTPYTAIKCSVLWFDTCPNKQAAADLVVFKKDPPNVVIWEPIPPVTMVGNEKVFVHGRSALRDWEAYRLQQIASGDWRIVDSYLPSMTNNWPVYVYAVVNASRGPSAK